MLQIKEVKAKTVLTPHSIIVRILLQIHILYAFIELWALLKSTNMIVYYWNLMCYIDNKKCSRNASRVSSLHAHQVENGHNKHNDKPIKLPWNGIPAFSSLLYLCKYEDKHISYIMVIRAIN